GDYDATGAKGVGGDLQGAGGGPAGADPAQGRRRRAGRGVSATAYAVLAAADLRPPAARRVARARPAAAGAGRGGETAARRGPAHPFRRGERPVPPPRPAAGAVAGPPAPVVERNGRPAVRLPGAGLVRAAAAGLESGRGL